MDKFEIFQQKEKFAEDLSIFYPGIASSDLLPILTGKINQAAEDFRQISLRPASTNDDYLQAIRTGLGRFEGIYLDSEDRERVCHYFEELMDIVGLESSDGQLMTFMYGFNPDDLTK